MVQRTMIWKAFFSSLPEKTGPLRVSGLFPRQGGILPASGAVFRPSPCFSMNLQITMLFSQAAKLKDPGRCAPQCSHPARGCVPFTWITQAPIRRYVTQKP